MAASGEATSGYWVALLIGLVLLVTFVATTGILHPYRAHSHETADQATDGLSDLLASRMGASMWRCQALITEAIIVRQRLSGAIDAETYRARMNTLARQAISERRPQRNA